VRLQILINGKELLSNYPATAPKLKSPNEEEQKEEENKEEKKEEEAPAEPYSFHESENLRPLSVEERKHYLSSLASGLYSIRLDSYTLPSLIIKMIKSMKKNGVIEATTTRIDKLKTNFANEDIGFDQY